MIYKEGDIVYHWNYGKGEVSEIDNSLYYPISVIFSTGKLIYFTKEGAESIHQEHSLSFTPYDLVKGGFSQKRPNPDIKTSQLVYVKTEDDHPWKMRYFAFWRGEDMMCFCEQKKVSRNVTHWPIYSLTNPLED